MTVQQIIHEISAYMAQFGSLFTCWYIGVAADPRSRLFCDHSVNESQDAWIFHPCNSDMVARHVERHFLSRGCRGGDGGGSAASRYIYAYKITPYTRQ